MGDPKGFLSVKRKESGFRPVEERVNDYGEVEVMLPEDERCLQAARCMDCGVPFCHWGCPVENIMPEWQEMIYKKDWKGAYDILTETNNFPEFTGRVCPAPCEASCVLSINDEPVTIRQNELSVIEKAFELGLVKPNPPERRTGKKVAIIGSGPAGLACADILNRFGHSVTVFESEDRAGGYLRFGIPDFKLDKKVIDRRLELLTLEGIEFKTSVTVGPDYSVENLKKEFDAVMIAIGARLERDLEVGGRSLDGIHFAMDYLRQQNKRVRGDFIPEVELIKAINRKVLVIGGGDTGSDCVGNANRQGAASITQVEILPEPPPGRTGEEPWPLWPRLKKTSSSHEEGCERMWGVKTLSFSGEEGKVKRAHAVKVQWEKDETGREVMKEIPGSEFEIETDLVLIAMGFSHVHQKGLVNDFGVKLNERGNISVNSDFMTSEKGIFSAGDSVRGASLVVWAIHEGREAAKGIHRYLSEE
jgi:glutamate synthase (NADPH/NADH) small chain